MSANLTVYKNPFSTATTNPKIPDGKCMLSAGQRLQATTELVNDTDAPMEILLYPGLTNGLSANSVVGTNNIHVPLTGNPNFQTMGYSNHAEFGVNQSNLTLEQTGPSIAAWRIVSQGVKLSLVNNFDENDGWWECVRVQAQRDPDHWTVIAGELGDGTAYRTVPDWASLGFANRNLIEHPSYKSGKLRDIGKQRFQLKPHMLDHDFVRLAKDHPHSNAIDDALQLEYNKPVGDNTTLTDYINEVQDNSYDMIFIRIHGRPSASGPTRILSHLVCNQELMYGEDSPLARFHNVGTKEKAFDAAKTSLQRNVAASTPTSMIE